MERKTRPLNIGIVVDQMLPGGVQLAAIKQVKTLNKLGHHAKLLILMRRKYSKDFSYLVNNIPHQYLSDSYPKFFQRTIKFPIFNFLSTLHLVSPIFAPNVIKHGDYDVLVSWGTTTCLTTQSIFKRNNIPYIAIIHDPIIYILDKVYSETSLKYLFPIIKPLAKYFEKSFLKDAAQTSTISKVHYNYLKKAYKINPVVVPLGIEVAKRIPKKRGTYILSFGRWQKEKNPELLLNVIKLIPKSRLIVAGTWLNKFDLNEFRGLIKKNGLNKRVTLVTQFTDGELRKLCRKARFFIHPHFEAFGLAALEAAGNGLPIIIPKASGVSEKFTHGKNGFFPDIASLAEYKKYSEILLQDENLAYEMGKSAFNIAKKEYSWETNVRNLLVLINRSITTSKKPKIIVIETGHALGISLAGGDKLMEPMATELSGKYSFEIIVPKIGAGHWFNASLPKKMHLLPKNKFDNKGTPIPVFLSYCIRIYQTTKILTGINDKDIIYSSTNILPDILPAYIAKIFSGNCKWIARIHHLIPGPQKREGRFLVNLVSFIMQKISLEMMKSGSDITIALNDNLEHELIDLGFSSHKMAVLGAGIHYNKIILQKPLTTTKNYDGVFLGRLHTTKGVFDLIPIWDSVVKLLPNAKLAVIGTGDPNMRRYLKKLTSDNKLGNSMFLLGYLNDTQVYSLLKKAKVFLFTDHEAGWSIATAEAMAAGLPVIGYDIGILGNVFRNGYRIVKLRNYDEFAENIVILLKNNKLRSKLSQEAISESSNYDWKQTTYKFNTILDKLIRLNEKSTSSHI
ncbi:glycosyltransferase [Candidatus Woesebacteria bacterium]|nr:glycosyltransferase [Candidatus Woesebacteria bacterium]